MIEIRRIAPVLCIALIAVTVVTGGISQSVFDVLFAVDALFGDIPSVRIVDTGAVLLPADPFVAVPSSRAPPLT